MTTLRLIAVALLLSLLALLAGPARGQSAGQLKADARAPST